MATLVSLINGNFSSSGLENLRVVVICSIVTDVAVPVNATMGTPYFLADQVPDILGEDQFPMYQCNGLHRLQRN